MEERKRKAKAKELAALNPSQFLKVLTDDKTKRKAKPRKELKEVEPVQTHKPVPVVRVNAKTKLTYRNKT